MSRRLSEIRGDDPMILTLARGHFCPMEHVQHLELAASYAKVAAGESWRDLRDVSRENRPDWDLAAPGLRDAWEAGDRSEFHGWNRRDPTIPSA